MNVAKTQPKVEKNVSRETLSNTTWGLVQDVATSEIKANGKMLYIFRNFLKMYKEKQLPIDKYFDETENDKSVEKILFNADKTRKTLIAKDFGKFVNLVFWSLLSIVHVVRLSIKKKDIYFLTLQE